MFKSISIPQKCLLLAITHGRDMLRISAGGTGREPGKSSLFTPCATQQHRETRPKLQNFSLALLFEADGPAPSNDGICLSKHQKGSITSDTVFELSLFKEKPFKSHSVLSMPGCFNFQPSSQKKFFCQFPQKDLFLTYFLPRI